MRKITLLVSSILVLTGGVYALVPLLFPDNAVFPRVPIGEGTLGSSIVKILGIADLGNYLGDGTVTNSQKLDGITASGYLKDTSACNVGEKWLSIDSTGNPTCGGATTLYADYGKIESQGCDATLYHASGSSDMSATGQILKSGDIVKTAPGCQMTILFDDLSILRLDGDTTVSLDIGYTATGGTMASAILANGSLWGRILTETGSYYIGTDRAVAGVRGTSISVISTGNLINVFPITMNGPGWRLNTTNPLYPIEIMVADTAGSLGATVLCKELNGKYTPLSNLRKEESYIIPTRGCANDMGGTHILAPNELALSADPIQSPIATSFNTNTWIQENTVKDIQYLYMLRALSGSMLSPKKKEIIDNEIAITIPTTIIGGTTLTASGIIEASTICPGDQRWWNARYGCQVKNILAIADYTLPSIESGSPTIPNLDIYITGGVIVAASRLTGGEPNLIPGQGISISTGMYLSYTGNSLVPDLLTRLAGKKYIISVTGIPTTNMTLIDFGNISGISYRVKRFTSSSYSCNWGTICSISSSINTVSFTGPDVLNYITLGNNQDSYTGVTSYMTALGGTALIQKIQITN